MRTLEKSIHNNAIGLNYMAVLMGIFGSIALALSAIGVYGVMAYLVSEQTHEIGLCMALGARRESVLGMVFRRGFFTTFAGLVAGLPVGMHFVAPRFRDGRLLQIGRAFERARSARQPPQLERNA